MKNNNRITHGFDLGNCFTRRLTEKEAAELRTTPGYYGVVSTDGLILAVGYNAKMASANYRIHSPSFQKPRPLC